ncbi:hypothetical protein KAH94_00635 [bacterium]|nr:hypothetical protein [bacterium]
MKSFSKLILLTACTVLFYAPTYANKKKETLKEKILKESYSNFNILGKSLVDIGGMVLGATITAAGLLIKEKNNDSSAAKAGGLMLSGAGGITFLISFIDLTVFKSLDLLKQAKAFYYAPIRQKKGESE